MKTKTTPRAEAAPLPLRVQPRASRNEIVGWQNGALRVRVTAPPVDGAANAAISALLAEKLRVAPSSITVVRGAHGRDKLVRIAGLSDAEIRERILRLTPGPKAADARPGDRSRLASLSGHPRSKPASSSPLP